MIQDKSYMYVTSEKHTEDIQTLSDQNYKLHAEINTMINTFNAEIKNLIVIIFCMAMLVVISIGAVIVSNIYYNNKLNTIMTEINETTQLSLATINNIDSTLSDYIDKIEFDSELIEETTQVDDTSNTIKYNTTDITQKSGYTAEQINEIVNTTLTNLNKHTDAFVNLGEGLYNAEKEYNINCLYLLGIASLESGWGTSKYATDLNNIYGLVGMKFNSVTECSEYMGALLRNSYIDKGYDSLSSIQTKYCPNNTTWTSSVEWCTNQYIKTAEALF